MRRLLVVLVALTVLVLVVDRGQPSWTAPLCAGVGAAVAPLQAALNGSGDVAEVVAERDRARVELALARAEIARMDAAQELAPAVAEREVVMARVVGVAPGTSPVAARTVSIDRGTTDGVAPDRTVVSTEGLVGRVVRVRDDSSDVLVLGDPGLVVGARYGEHGALASVDARPAPGLPPRGPGELTLTALGDTPVQAGDEVRTLGSPSSVPYAADVLVGTVTSVDPEAGQLGTTAVLAPAADLDTLDHVAVVLPPVEP